MKKHGEHESDEADGRDPWWQRGCSGPVRDRHPGAFCASGAWIDLSSRIKSDRVNLNLFPKTIRDYTAYGISDALALADAYGFYYNRALFAKRRDSSRAPRSLAQLGLREEAAQRDADGDQGSCKLQPAHELVRELAVPLGPLVGATWMKNGSRTSPAIPAGRRSAVAEEPRRLVRIQEPRQVAGKRRGRWTASNAFPDRQAGDELRR